MCQPAYTQPQLAPAAPQPPPDCGASSVAGPYGRLRAESRPQHVALCSTFMPAVLKRAAPSRPLPPRADASVSPTAPAFWASAYHLRTSPGDGAPVAPAFLLPLAGALLSAGGWRGREAGWLGLRLGGREHDYDLFPA